MRTVTQVSRLTGVSVRTLHHYDAIGILRPTEVTEAGYRLYDDTALARLQSILLFRELQFSLSEIKTMLDSPDFDEVQALETQIGLLEAQKRHIEELIAFARQLQKKERCDMKFDAFDKSEIEAYKTEAREKWGGTAAYNEYESREQQGSVPADAAQRMMALFSEIGALRDLSPDDSAVQAKIGELQQFISDNYYTCTNEILRGLGQMYVGDERFRDNIDKAGGEGTAEFAARAIEIYCS